MVVVMPVYPPYCMHSIYLSIHYINLHGSSNAYLSTFILSTHSIYSFVFFSFSFHTLSTYPPLTLSWSGPIHLLLLSSSSKAYPLLYAYSVPTYPPLALS